MAMQGKPKLSDLISLKLNDWFKVGEKIGIDRQSLYHIKRRYKDNRHECQKGMFAKWIRSEEHQSYEPLLQALVNAGETRAAEELHQKFDIPYPLLSQQPPALLGSEYLSNINIILSGPDKTGKSKLHKVINEYIEERQTRAIRKWERELESIRPIWEDNEWTNPAFLSFVQEDFPKMQTWRRVDMGELAEVNEIGPLLLMTRSFNFVCLDVQSEYPIPLYDTSGNIHSYANQFSQFKKSFFHQTLHTIGSLWSKDGNFSSKAFAAAVICHLGSKDPLDKYVAQIDAALKSSLQESGYSQGNVIKFCHFETGQMMFPITKYSDEHHDRIKYMLDDVKRHQCCEKVVPTSVYKFACLCHFMGSILNINKAEELAYVCGIHKEEAGHILNYIRDQFGVIFYYGDVPALDNVVICEPQLLIDAFTRLVNEIMQLNPEICFSGTIGCNAVSHHTFPNEVSSVQVTELLKHLNLISKISFDDMPGKYFMPFLLSYDPLVDKASIALWNGYYPFPIAICFSTHKIPAGIFYALVCQLTKSWQLSAEQQYKNRILFQVKQGLFCSLVDHSHFMEVHVRAISKDNPPTLYRYILKEIKDKLECVMASFQHTEQVTAMVRFFCPSSFEQQFLHLATIDDNMKIHCDHCPGVFECPESYSVWFSNREELLCLFTSLSKFISTSDENDEIFAMVQDHIEHKGSIKLRVGKSIFFGPPGAGKTSSRMRLTGEIISLSDGMPTESTGIEKPITLNIFHTTETKSVLIANDSKQWRPQDVESQADTFINCVIYSNKFNSVLFPSPMDVSPHINESKTIEIDLLEHNSTIATSNALSHSASSLPPNQSKSNDLLLGTNNCGPLAKQNQQQPLWLIQQEESLLFVQEMIKAGRWKELQELLKDVDDLTMLQIIDTGGQPEFHEILPLLLPGPALYMIFINLTQKLNESYDIAYTQKDRMLSSICYTSNFTYKEMLLQLLTTISSMNLGSKNLKSIAMLLGTHGDKVTREEITSLEESILSSEEIGGFIDRGILKRTPFENMSQCLFPLNNLDGSPEEIQELQKIIGNICQIYFQPEDIPISWFFFYLALRKKYEVNPGYCSIEEATFLASGYGISFEDVNNVLTFIHLRFGTILFYPNIPGLSNLVICDPNVVFKPISHLIAASFGDNSLNPFLIERIRCSGQFPLDFFEHVSKFAFDSVITPLSILDILKHQKIVSEVRSFDNVSVFFMPCLLQPDPNVGQESIELLYQFNAAPLVVSFREGFVPIGFFPVLIVQLSHKWLLQNQIKQFRNHIFFIADPSTLTQIELILYANKMEVRVKCDSLLDAKRLCVAALSEIYESIEVVKTSTEYMRNVCLDFGFYCPQSLQEGSKPHFAGCLEMNKPEKMFCIFCNRKCVKLLEEHKMWFPGHEDPVEDMDMDKTPPPPMNDRQEVNLKENQVNYYILETKPDKFDLLHLLCPIAYNWEQIGTALKINYGDLKSIQHSSTCSDVDKLSEILQLWIDKEPTEVTWNTILSVVMNQPVDSCTVAVKILEFVSKIETNISTKF